MNKPLLYFSYLIIIANFLFFLIGFTNNIGIVGSYLGFLGAIGTDPVIIFYAVITGAGLVVQQSRFSILYFILAAVVGAAAVHYFLGTKMFIIDVVRFDALLIMPALIVIVASFFSPKSKDSAKKAPAKKVPIKKFNKDSNKGIRSILLILIISVSTFLLVTPSPRESLVGENVTQYVLKPFFTSSRILKCTKKRWYGSTLLPMFKCYTVDIDKFTVENNLEKTQVEDWVSSQKKLPPEVLLNSKIHKSNSGIGTFYLKKKYSTDKNTVTKTINILHPILLIILIFYTWRLRFCITGITVSLFKKIKAAI